MTFGQRLMLLCALFFFFIMGLFAIADWGGKKTGALVASSMPPSVLSYPEELTADGRSVPCYAGSRYEQFIAGKAAEGYKLAVAGDVSDGDRMEIHAAPNGNYIVIVRGPDPSGMDEGCQVTEGWNFAGDPSAAATLAATAPAAQNVPATTPTPQ